MGDCLDFPPCPQCHLYPSYNKNPFPHSPKPLSPTPTFKLLRESVSFLETPISHRMAYMDDKTTPINKSLTNAIYIHICSLYGS